MIAVVCAGDVGSALAATSRSSAAIVRNIAPAAAGDIVSRSATSRRATSNPRTSAAPTVQGVVYSRSAARQASAPAARVGANVTARSGATPAATAARSAKTPSSARSAVVQASAARAAASRATAIFDDVSKLGGGYATCRDAYNTCMDQFCAKSNDTYRRCYCSQRYTEFSDTEAALDEAKTLLMRFEDNSLNAIDKTAAEVTAMYSATVGESAIKNDTSGAQKTLNEIADLLSGKKKPNSKAVASLSGLSLDFATDLGDIWGDNGGGGIFSSNSNAQDMSKLEGLQLYNAAHKQCTDMVQSSCSDKTVFNMTKSSYSILITQDCNAYEKKVDTQKEAVTKTIRDAEKILRTARLEEYRSHNSADINECITKVKTAITAETACGPNYRRCLDWTGLYINPNTGEPIYSAHLQDLPTLIKLDLGADPSNQPEYNKYMNDKRMFATTALDTCRDKADVVWNEFKRSAMIEISQAQDEKIEEVKDSCVATMAECYNKQSGDLASFDNTTAQATGALNAYAARQMCMDKVAACAAVYAPAGAEQCRFDQSTGKVINGHTCGLQVLQDFVQAVDNVKVAEGCEVGLQNFIKSTCAPAAGDTAHQSPYGCRLQGKTAIGADKGIKNLLEDWALKNCKDPAAAEPANYAAFVAGNPTVGPMVDTAVRKILEEIDYALYDECDKAEGIWQDTFTAATDKYEETFYKAVYSGTKPTPTNGYGTWGYCVQNTVMYMCKSQDSSTGDKGYATFNSANNTCTFKEEWYEIKCKGLGGYYEGGSCYI